MYFYRVQNENGKGYYIGGNYNSYDRRGNCWNTKKHVPKHNNSDPSLCAELKEIKLQSDYIFGFQTLKQLESWFSPEELIKLHNQGFKITRVKGKLIKASKYQAIFRKL